MKKNANYWIVKETEITDNISIVLGIHSEKEMYVTWLYNKTKDSYYFGHYISNWRNARIDYHERIIDEIKLNYIEEELDI